MSLHDLAASDVSPASPSDAPAALGDGDRFLYVDADDPRARPLLDDLEREYDERYGLDFGGPASEEIHRYPVDAFRRPQGAFVLLLRDGEPIAGGAFKRFDESTSELKRIWTAASHRRQGLARLVVAELEAQSRRSGYTTVYLTTGPRQPEAQRLYTVTGYTPLYDVTLTAEQVGVHGFAKSLTADPLEVPAIRAKHERELARFFASLPQGSIARGAPDPAPATPAAPAGPEDTATGVAR